jgi:hypothetical protein
MLLCPEDRVSKPIWLLLADIMYIHKRGNVPGQFKKFSVVLFFTIHLKFRGIIESSIARFSPPVIMMRSSIPEAIASSTTYWITGVSIIGSISFGIDLVAGRNRVPRPAAGIIAFLTVKVDSPLERKFYEKVILIADLSFFILIYF